MSDYYAQLDYDQPLGINAPSTIYENGSFVVAMCNLIRKMDLGYNIDPASLNEYFQANGLYAHNGDEVLDKLHWDSLIKYDSGLKIRKLDSVWPRFNNSIVKFRCQSSSMPMKDGQPNMITHFCAVYDYDKKLIIDSYDGEIKPAGKYGNPVGCASYEYTVDRGVTKYEDVPGIHYEKFPQPRPMYIGRAGAKKVIFGQINHLNDIPKTTTGKEYAYGEEVWIYGKARHPVFPLGATFYLDGAAMGSFSATGKIAEAVGFYESHVFPTPPPPLTKVEDVIRIDTRPHPVQPVQVKEFAHVALPNDELIIDDGEEGYDDPYSLNELLSRFAERYNDVKHRAKRALETLKRG